MRMQPGPKRYTLHMTSLSGSRNLYCIIVGWQKRCFHILPLKLVGRGNVAYSMIFGGACYYISRCSPDRRIWEQFKGPNPSVYTVMTGYRLKGRHSVLRLLLSRFKLH